MKYAVVTGAAGGIGYATVCRLIQDDYHVLATDILAKESVEEKFAQYGGRVQYIAADLSQRDDREMIIAASAELPRLDVLVNVAGVAPKVRADILDMTEESYDRVMNINLKATLFLTQALAKQMINCSQINR